MGNNVDVVIREVFTGMSLAPLYEVRLGPCPWASDQLVWRVTRPVTRERATELVGELLALLRRREAFAMPPEFNITGRLEPVSNIGGQNG